MTLSFLGETYNYQPPNTEIRQEFYPETHLQSDDDHSYYLLRLSVIWGEDFLDTATTDLSGSQQTGKP